ncbi:hypothetical protein LTS02_003867 [Friedmanniomyces endolithicus]|nr:hypothetical protein LTS02_003867 [Friedmanniomyces endolithicus]
MHHRHGFSVTLSHAEGEYEEHPVPIDEARWTSEYPENTRLDGGCNSTVSQVAITRTLEPAGAEAFTCRLTLWGNFEWFSASALRVIVRYGTQGHKNSVNTCIIRRHAPSTRAGTLVVRKFPDLCGLLPPPQADGAELSRTWSTRWVANPGSVAVFLTRGHVCKAGALGSSGPDPRESQQARTLNGVAASRIFKPLKSYNGATYCFEFQVRPKDYGSTALDAGTGTVTEPSFHPSADNHAQPEDQASIPQSQEPPETKPSRTVTARPSVHRSSENSGLGVVDEPSDPFVEENGANVEHGPPGDVGLAASEPGYIEASDAQDAGTAGHSLETDDSRPTIVQEDIQTSLPPPAAIESPRQCQKAPIPALAIHEEPINRESPTPQHSQPPTRPHFDIDLTLDNEEVILVKQEAEIPSARKRQLVIEGEDEEDEDELRDQMMEVELEKKEIELRRKMRGLKKRKEKQRVVAKREG